MYPRGPCRQRDIYPIVHEDPSPRPGRGSDELLDQRDEVGSFKVGFTHLHEVNARCGGSRDLPL
jgi:hypothetical protein